MAYKIVLIILTLGVVACSSSEKSSSESRSETVEKDSTKKAPPVDSTYQLAPGRAMVTIKWNADTEVNGLKVWNVMMKHVKGYGSSTPLIDAGVEMSLDITDYMNGYDTSSKEVLSEKGHTLVCVIEHKAEQMGGFDAETPRWQLIRIIENE